jgi:hypothetical protein
MAPSDVEFKDDGPRLAISNPIATLLHCENDLFLCVGEVNAIYIDSKCADEVPVAWLKEQKVSIGFQVLKLK